jgi:hypothetical protein
MSVDQRIATIKKDQAPGEGSVHVTGNKERGDAEVNWTSPSNLAGSERPTQLLLHVPIVLV